MSKPVKMYNLDGSPHNMKVRMALTYKNIPYEKIPVDPSDRSIVVKASGQPLTPVLVHGDHVIYDSYGITRYLDANWPSQPRLYTNEQNSMRDIEAWENFARNEVGPTIGMVFNEFFSQEKNPSIVEKANMLINEAGRKNRNTPC